MKFIVFVFLSFCHYSLCSDNSTENGTSTEVIVAENEAYTFLDSYYEHLNKHDYSLISLNFSGNVAGHPVSRQQYINALQQLERLIPGVFNKPVIDVNTFTASFVKNDTFKINFQNDEVWTVDIINDDYSFSSLVAQ